MKAILQTGFGNAETLHIGDTERPVIESNEVLVEVHYSGLNRADILQREGKYPPPEGESTILGLEASGLIVELGEDVIGFEIGDRVMALLAGGGQAEFVSVDSNLVWKVPAELTLEQASAIPEVFLTAYQALFFEGKTETNRTVLIHAGASGVGTAAIQLAKSKNCLVVTTSSQSKLDICKNLGADLTINYQKQDFAKEVNKFTSGKGVDIILDFIGAPYFEQNLQCLSVDGTLMMISVMGGVKLDNLNVYPILTKRLSVRGTTLRSRTIEYKHALINAFLNDFSMALTTGKIFPVIDSVFNWVDIKEAHNHMEANLNKGKIVLKIRS